MHCIWQLPEGEKDYSKRWGMIKANFTRRIYKMIRDGGLVVKGMLPASRPSKSQQDRHEGMIWQRRFWEHQIRDDRDLRHHCDYIHFNPVKHGLAKTPSEWPYSTIHGFIAKKIYPVDRGGKGTIEIPAQVGKE